MKPDSKQEVATMAEESIEEKTTESPKFTLASHHKYTGELRKNSKQGLSMDE